MSFDIEVKLEEHVGYRYQKVGPTRVKRKVDTRQFKILIKGEDGIWGHVGYVGKPEGAPISFIVRTDNEFLSYVAQEVNRIRGCEACQVTQVGSVVEIVKVEEEVEDAGQESVPEQDSP